jgi:O-antigen/teichoic acid export membrane protein
MNMRIFRNAAALVGTQGVTSVFGFAYWWLAARWFDASSVGAASAIVSAMTLIATFGMLGLGALLIGHLPRNRAGAPRLVTTAVLVAGAVSAALGVGFALVSPLVSPEIASLAGHLDHLVIFAIGAALTGMSLVLDQAAVGVMRSSLQFWRNTIFSVVKLAALAAVGIWLARTDSYAIFITWVLGVAVSLAAIVVMEARQGKLNRRYRPELRSLSGMEREALAHHGLNLILLGPGLFLPLIVTALLSAEMNAYFYTAWMLNGFVTVVPVALTTVLFAAVSEDRATLPQRLRLTLGASLAYGVAAILVIAVAGRWLLGLFGPNYADEGATALTILAFSVIPLVISEHFVALARIERRPGRATVPMGVSNLLKLVFAAAGAKLAGLTGLSIGILVASVAVALYVLPPVLRAMASLGAASTQPAEGQQSAPSPRTEAQEL